MTVTVAVLVGYLATLAALAIWSRKETHTLKGFYQFCGYAIRRQFSTMVAGKFSLLTG